MSDDAQRQSRAAGGPALTEGAQIRIGRPASRDAIGRPAPKGREGRSPAECTCRAAPRLRVAAPSSVALAASGCSRAPSQNILGSFFPSWMLCLAIGVLVAVLVRQAFVLVGFDRAIPFPLLTYLALALAVTFLLWLLVYGH